MPLNKVIAESRIIPAPLTIPEAMEEIISGKSAINALTISFNASSSVPIIETKPSIISGAKLKIVEINPYKIGTINWATLVIALMAAGAIC